MIAVSQNQVIRIVTANDIVHRSVIMVGEQTHETLGDFHALPARAKPQLAPSLQLIETIRARRTKIRLQPTKIALIMFLD